MGGVVVSGNLNSTNSERREYLRLAIVLVITTLLTSFTLFSCNTFLELRQLTPMKVLEIQ